jgi:hypothetical protein
MRFFLSLAWLCFFTGIRAQTNSDHQKNHVEEKIISLVRQTYLYRTTSKRVTKLSSGKRSLHIAVNQMDSTRKTYLVKVLEDNGSSLVTYFNFLVDAQKMKIINPSGKVQGQKK